MLANTDELQNKIAELTNRAKVLEDALAKSYGVVSLRPHPLLNDGFLQSEQTEPSEPSRSPGLSVDSPTPRTENGEEREKENDEALAVYNASLGSL